MMVAAERQSTIYFTGMKSEIIQNKVAKNYSQRRWYEIEIAKNVDQANPGR